MTSLFTSIILQAGHPRPEPGRPAGGHHVAPLLLGVIGLLGVVAMLVAVAVGVWISVRISIGNNAASTNPSFTWWVINRLAFLVGTTNLSTFAIYFLQGRLGLERERAAGPAALLMMVIGIFILLAALPSGILGDRFGHKHMVFISGIVATLGVLIALLSPNMTVIYVGGNLIGIATGFFFTNWALGTRIVPHAGRAATLASRTWRAPAQVR